MGVVFEEELGVVVGWYTRGVFVLDIEGSVIVERIVVGVIWLGRWGCYL